MNNINGLNGYTGPQAVGRARVAKDGPTSPAQQNAASGQDRVEISSAARFLSRVHELPEVRTEKVAQVRQALSNGTYDVDGKLSTAVDRFLEETFGE